MAPREEQRIVECPVHGSEAPAYVCRHLDLATRAGFVEGYHPERPEEDLYHAWCSACDEVLEREGEWNDRSESFAGVRLVCRACYREMKALNRSHRF
jgi:hypothetical protein